MTTNICPDCHTAIPAEAPGGFCPACVLRGAEETAPAAAPGSPSLEEVRAAFPQLEIEALIGQGGMGSVYKARQPSLDRTVALKILSPALSRDPAFAERFAREARVLGRLSHPNIVTVYEHGQSRGFYYLLMEYVDGVNLRQAMQAGRFTQEQALAVVPGICDALQAAHAQGIWHRDIKPENILLDARGGVKIADFGIARLAGDPQQAFTLTMTGARLGSAAYMAPEQHEKPHDVDHRADIYSLGVVIYEMLTGELPLGRFKAPSTKAAVDARIDEIVLRTLEKERELRQQSAVEVKTGVADAASSPPCPPQEVRRSSMPVTFRLAMTAGFVLLLSSGFLTYGSAQGVLMSVSLVLIVVGLTGAFIYRGKTPHLRISRGVAGAFLVFVLLGAGWGYLEQKQKRQRAELEAEAAHRSRLNVMAVLEARRAEKPVNENSAVAAETSNTTQYEPPMEPAEPCLLVLRRMNEMANKLDGTAFLRDYETNRISSLKPATELMEPFMGKMVWVKPAPRVSVSEASVVAAFEYTPTPGVPRALPVEEDSRPVTAAATLRYQEFAYRVKDDKWVSTGAKNPMFMAPAKVRFRPPQGDPLAILRQSVKKPELVRAVDGEAGVFTVSDSASTDWAASSYTSSLLTDLSRLLSKAGPDSSLEILSPPAASEPMVLFMRVQPESLTKQSGAVLVTGEVSRAATFFLDESGALTARSAVRLAGGPTTAARKDKFILLRGDPGQSPQVTFIAFDSEKPVTGAISDDPPLEAGDRIVVPHMRDKGIP